MNRLHYGNIRDFIKGIRNDEVEFYDEYPNCKEVLVVGSSNAGKSTLINVLNEKIKVAKTQAACVAIIVHTASARGT